MKRPYFGICAVGALLTAIVAIASADDAKDDAVKKDRKQIEKANYIFGIYELGDKTRKLCFAPPGKERPADFSSAAGSGHILVTFEREKAK